MYKPIINSSESLNEATLTDTSSLVESIDLSGKNQNENESDILALNGEGKVKNVNLFTTGIRRGNSILQETKNDYPKVTLQEVMQRKFHNKYFGRAIALVVIVNEDPDSLNNTEVISAIITSDFGNSNETTLSDTKETEELNQEYYIEQYRKGVELLIRHGYLPEQLVRTIEHNLFSPDEIKVVKNGRSGWYYSGLNFPDKQVGFELSLEHIVEEIDILKKIFEEAGLINKIGEQSIRDLATQKAVMHEFGHGVHRALEIIKASQIAERELGGKSITDLMENNRDKFWALWDRIGSEFTKELSNTSGDIRRRNEILDLIGDANGLEDTYVESIATGSEDAVLLLFCQELGFSETEVKSVMLACNKREQRLLDDAIYFAKIAKEFGVDEVKFNKIKNTITDTLQGQGLDISSLLPFYGLGAKQFGYYMHLKPDVFKKFVNHFYNSN